jgi:hypothetical protein
MKLKLLLLVMPLLLPWVQVHAGEPLTIPPEIAQSMKKGSKLVSLWIAPDFDGSKGFKLGQISNETNDSASVVQEYFPYALRKFLKNDSPYVLHMAIVGFKLKSSNSASNARLEVEGRIVDKSGKLVSAFIGYALETIGGNANDSARYAVNRIAFAMAKDLMEFALPKEDRSPAVIVAAPPSTSQASTHPMATPVVPVPGPSSAPAAVPPAPTVPAPAVASANVPALVAEPGPAADSGTTAPAKAPSTAPLTAPVAIPAPAESSAPAAGTTPIRIPAAPAAEPVEQAFLVPPAVAGNLKPGAALRGLWVSPAYVKASGFSIGEVRYRVENRNDGIDKVLPESLAEIAKEDAPCRLDLQIVELTIRTQARGISNVALGVEGRLVAKDGTVVAAFKTRESVTGLGDLVDDCRLATRKVVRSIVKDLLQP